MLNLQPHEILGLPSQYIVMHYMALHRMALHHKASMAFVSCKHAGLVDIHTHCIVAVSAWYGKLALQEHLEAALCC